MVGNCTDHTPRVGEADKQPFRRSLQHFLFLAQKNVTVPSGAGSDTRCRADSAPTTQERETFIVGLPLSEPVVVVVFTSLIIITAT